LVGKEDKMPIFKSEKYPRVTQEEFRILKKVLLTRDRITYTEHEEMQRTEHDIYVAICSAISKGEEHKLEIQKSKSKKTRK